jgi:hypothetical protein
MSWTKDSAVKSVYSGGVSPPLYSPVKTQAPMEKLPMARRARWNDVGMGSPWHVSRHTPQNSASPPRQNVVFAYHKSERA